MGLPEKLLIGLLLLLIAFIGGVYIEHEKFMAYVNMQAGIAKAQADSVRKTDERNKEGAKHAQDNFVQAIQGIHDYYQLHPVVRVRNIAGACGVPEAAGRSQSPDGTAPGLFLTPYSPIDSETIAVRLDTLQKLLMADGVAYE
jgi:hypothetical protein